MKKIFPVTVVMVVLTCVLDSIAQIANLEELRAPEIILSFDLSGRLQASSPTENTALTGGRKYFSNPILINELDLSDEQERKFSAILRRWENLETKYLSDQVKQEQTSQGSEQVQANDEGQTKKYLQKCVEFINEIELVLMPQQRETVRQTVKRIIFEEVGLINYVNHHWRDLGISPEEFSKTIQMGQTVVDLLDKRVGELRKEVFSVCMDRLSPKLQDYLNERLENSFSEIPIEALNWHLTLLEREKMEIDLNQGLEMYFDVPLFEIQMDGNLKPAKKYFRKKTDSSSFRLLLELLENEEWCALLKISGQEKLAALKVRDEFNRRKEDDWSELSLTERDHAKNEFIAVVLPQLQRLIEHPRKQQIVDEFSPQFAERCYGPMALLFWDISKLKLTPQDREQLLANAGQGVQLIKTRGRTIYSEIMELASSKLSESSRRRLNSEIGPPFKNSNPSMLYLRYNLMNLR